VRGGVGGGEGEHKASQHKNLYLNAQCTNNSKRNSAGFHNFTCVNNINIGNNFCVEKHIHALCGENADDTYS
jgi:hypothetical protein